MSASLLRGIKIATAAPTSGMNTASASAQWSNAFIVLLGDVPIEDGGEDERRPEHDGGVLLHAPGLAGAENAAALFGGEPGPVDAAVDTLLVDDVVGEGADGAGGDADG